MSRSLCFHVRTYNRCDWIKIFSFKRGSSKKSVSWGLLSSAGRTTLSIVQSFHSNLSNPLSVESWQADCKPRSGQEPIIDNLSRRNMKELQKLRHVLPITFRFTVALHHWRIALYSCYCECCCFLKSYSLHKASTSAFLPKWSSNAAFAFQACRSSGFSRIT